MNTQPQDALAALRERAKELSCIYRVLEILTREGAPSETLFAEVVQAIPGGWQYPDGCQAVLTVHGRTYRSGASPDTEWAQRATVKVQGAPVGELAVYYTERFPDADEGPFLKEERKLLDTLAGRIGLYLAQRELAEARGRTHATPPGSRQERWRVALDFLERVDRRLVEWITRKMLNHLRWKGLGPDTIPPERGALAGLDGAENRPLSLQDLGEASLSTEHVFALAAEHLTEEEILSRVQMWISQDRARFLITTLEDQGSSLDEIVDGLDRFQVLGVAESELPRPIHTMLRVALLRRFFSDQVEFVNMAKDLVRLSDFHALSHSLIHPSNSHGRLGGKSSGLFLASKVIEASPERGGVLRDLKVPRTWYVASDGVLAFVRHNSLEEVYDRKYMEIEEVRAHYRHVVRVFKGSRFPPELANGLVIALDDLGACPLIVRSSSLLEDRTGAAFSGKYKSLFLANQGTKQERLQALQDAVAEVYASIFGPDPIQYRAERNLLDLHEEMGIMIQQVVGTRVGRWFLPAFSGVAFSHNEFRWSPRIRREDGLLRLVPGLGTRAVDRLGDDYPVLLAPGRPTLRVNVTPDETLRYSPRMVDVIDLETNSFATIPARTLLREHGNELPLAREMLSIVDDGALRDPGGLAIDFSRHDAVFTFEGLVSRTPFVTELATLLRVLCARLGTPVDVEFACDGKDLYLLQCRPLSHRGEGAPAEIPHDVAPERILFSASRHVSNGRVPDLTHIVYVDPEGYSRLQDAEQLRDVARAVSRLNEILPRRRFVLMGPGRWGSRDDIRLGVSVTYADIHNTAVLIEIAHRHGNYVPDLSFGTHFFQDLVEAEIRYLPLYPDEPGNRFQEAFLRSAPSVLAERLPHFAHLSEVLRVIEVPAVTGGKVLRILMNADRNEAIGLLTEPDGQGAARAASDTHAGE